MPSDAEITLAFVAKRQGKEVLPASEWSNVLSLELGWMEPGAAKTFVADCTASGLLREDGDALALAFDRKAVDIPNRYRPPEDLAAAPPSTPPSAGADDTAPGDGDDPFRALVVRIVTEGPLAKHDVLDQVTAMQGRFGGRLTADAAAVLVAMAHGIDVRDAAKACLERIRSTST